MSRALVTLFLILIAVLPLTAQTPPDIRITINSDANTGTQPQRYLVGEAVSFGIQVLVNPPVETAVPLEIEIPGELVDVHATPALGCSTALSSPIRCTIPGNPFTAGVVNVFSRFHTPGTYTATVRVQGQTVTHTFEIVDLPSVSTSTVRLGGDGFQVVVPGQQIAYESTVQVQADATNLRVRYTLPDGGTFISARVPNETLQCTVTPQEVVCTRPVAARGTTSLVEILTVAPERLTGGAVTLRAEVTHDSTDFDPSDDVAQHTLKLARIVAVTNTNDEGSGSLRQALLDTQAFCESAPCHLVFNIPGTPPNGAFAITPKSALPMVRGWVKIDGATQAAFSTATTGQAARIHIFGDEAGLAHGLLIGPGCEIQVLNLSISGFAWPGIEAQRSNTGECAENQFAIPLVIARNELRRNYRGVVLVDTGFATISENVIAQNVRSGIFADGGLLVQVYNNQVVENGASGMFFNVGTRGFAIWGATVSGNLIANNREWGITRTDKGQVGIQRNSIFGNVHPAIDLNLDFETPNRPFDDFSSIPNKPVLLSAFYDAAQNTTFVTGRLDSSNPFGSDIEIDFYANGADTNPAHYHAEMWVGVLQLGTGDTDPQFTFAIPQNLKGKHLVATNTRSRNIGLAKSPGTSSQSHVSSIATDTSELSNAVLVQ